MKKTPLQILSDLDFENKLKKSSMPAHTIPRKKYSDKSANELTKSVIALIQLTGGQAERISIQGQFRDNRKVVTDCLGFKKTIGSVEFTKSNMTKGTADISASIKPKGFDYAASVKIEIKYGKDRQSEAQKDYEGQVQMAGGIYLIVRTFDQFFDWYKEFTGLELKKPD